MYLKTLESDRSELRAEVATGPVTVEAKFLSDLIRENRELKQMVGELLLERRMDQIRIQE